MLFTPLYGTLLMAGATSARVCKPVRLQMEILRTFQLYTNPSEIKSLGFGLGLSRKVYKILKLD
jgi:hypothetical protein